MIIEKAKKDDINGINKLLHQVLMVHHKGRPDIFKSNTKKYSDNKIAQIISNDTTPVFVAKEENGAVLGYAFCVIIQHKNNNILTDIKTLYIDDLCVDETKRGNSIGKNLYEYVTKFAREINCYNITLNVWSCNKNAIKFYEKMGLIPQKIGLEKIL